MQLEFLLFLIFCLWSLLVLLLQGAGDPLSKAKVPFYVALTLIGVMLAARDARWSLENILCFCVLAGGVGSAFSMIYFYFGTEYLPGQRLIAIGLWDKAIMAAHAVGALIMLGVFLVAGCRLRFWLFILLMFALLAELLFIGLNQTRGVWLSLVAALFFLVVALPSRLGWFLLGSVLVGVAGLILFEPQLLLQRGLSYRPTLWAGGLQLFSENWLFGLGFNSYEIAVPAINETFKHPHNLFLDIAVRLGLPGLTLFCLLWLATLRRAWLSRRAMLGRALMALWAFSSVALLTDGIGLWLKPNADWLITWLPIALGLVLAERGARLEVQEICKA